MTPPSDTVIPPVSYFHGSEDYLMEIALGEIKAKVLTGAFDSLNHHVFEAAAVDPVEVISAALTLPAFAPSRFVVVKGAEALKVAAEREYVAYVDDPSPTTFLVFVSNSAKPPAASPLFKALSAKGWVRRFNRLYDRELLGWIKTEAEAQGKKLSIDAARKVLALVGPSLRDIKGELDKIITYAGDKGAVSVQDVEDAGCDVREETAFTLAELIGKRDLGGAFRILAKVAGEPPVKTLGAIASQFRFMLKIKSCLSRGVPEAKIARVAGVYPRYLSRYLTSCKRFTERELIAAYSMISDADLAFKSSRFPRELLLSKLVLDLCGGQRG